MITQIFNLIFSVGAYTDTWYHSGKRPIAADKVQEFNRVNTAIARHILKCMHEEQLSVVELMIENFARLYPSPEADAAAKYLFWLMEQRRRLIVHLYYIIGVCELG